MSIERDLDQAFHQLDLSSRSNSKFDEARALLEERWGIRGLALKALGDPKNYGNRISEGTGAGATALLLVAEADLDEEALQRAYLGRATSRVPAMLVERTALGTRPRLVLTDGPNPFPWSDVVVAFEPTVVLAARADEADVKVRELLALDGGDPEKVLAALQAAASSTGIHVKHVSDAKNLRNRVREALGHQPGILVVVVNEELEERARTYLCSLYGAVPHLLLAVRGAELRISRVKPAPSPQSATRSGNAMLEIEPDLNEDGPVAYQVNRTVTELGHYLPFDAAAGNLYEEHVNVQQRLEFDTAALGFIRKLIGDARVSMVVLTGNAGHGKTHLCRRLLSFPDADPHALMKSLSTDLMGETLVEIPGSPRGVRIIKDLSELSPPEVAATRLERMLGDTDSLAIVCANEGRLRHVVSLRPSLRILVDTLEAGIRSGATSIDERIHVVNLNYQAVTPHSRSAFLDFALDHWLSNGNRWRKCQQCLAADTCPILANRSALSASPEVRRANRPVRDALSHLVRLAEQSGYVLTIREGLIFVAFLITGGLGCDDVHRLHKHGKVGGYTYLESLFSRDLAQGELDQLGVLKRIRRFDPGKTAIRSIDERLHRELEGSGQFGNAVLEVGARPPSTRDQLRREQNEHRDRLRQARRRDYFSPKADSSISHSRRLGLLHHKDFLDLQSRSNPDSRMLEILERLVSGLHVVQGIRFSGEGSGVLFLVDPAFSRSANRSAVIAFQFDQRALELVGEAEYWRQTEREPRLLEAVDWLDRRVVLAHRADDGAPPTLVLDFDLLQFEFVMRSATGVVFEEFNAAERKRIVSRLAKLAEDNRQMTKDIKVMEGGTLRRLILERDNSFRVATVG